jgi:hypothetical protein
MPATTIVFQNDVCGVARIIARQMNTLCWEIDCFERVDRLRRRQTLLTAIDGTF